MATCGHRGVRDSHPDRFGMSNVEEHIFLARVAEQAERFEDMVDQLENVLKEKGAGVSSDERNLLSVAFKNLISSKRAACRTIVAIEQNPKYSKFNEALTTYKGSIETKLSEDCQRIVDMINKQVLEKTCDGEAKAFFVKMVGDYYRYMAENAKGDSLEKAKQAALKAYQDANSITLPPCNPIKLGLALNYSVFHYEAMKNKKAACELADQTLQDALDKIDELEEDDFRDAKSIIELLKENLTLWREEEDDDNQIDDL
jgi:14-3-3 protein epsilon